MLESNLLKLRKEPKSMMKVGSNKMMHFLTILSVIFAIYSAFIHKTGGGLLLFFDDELF